MDEFKKYLVEYAEYLEDARKKLYKLVVIFIGAFALGFFMTTPFLKLFLSNLKIKDVVITTTSPFQIVDLAMNVGILFAVIVIAPFFVRALYVFLKPALLGRERRFFFLLLPIGLVLFAVGFVYGFAAMYYALKLIAQVNVNLGVINLWDINRFISQMVLTSTFLGLIFQFPIVVTFLIKMNMVTASFLKSKRRHAYVAIFVFVSLLPPTDGLSLIIMSLPLLAIYELTILFNSYSKKATVILINN